MGGEVAEAFGAHRKLLVLLMKIMAWEAQPLLTLTAFGYQKGFLSPGELSREAS